MLVKISRVCLIVVMLMLFFVSGYFYSVRGTMQDVFFNVEQKPISKKIYSKYIYGVKKIYVQNGNEYDIMLYDQSNRAMIGPFRVFLHNVNRLPFGAKNKIIKYLNDSQDQGELLYFIPKYYDNNTHKWHGELKIGNKLLTTWLKENNLIYKTELP